MRYLKKYTLFEDKGFRTYKEMVEEMEDILIPITDLGYNPDVKLINHYNKYIQVNIIRYEDDPLKPELLYIVEDEIDRLYEFAKSNGFLINKFYYKLVQPDGRIFNKYEDLETIHGYDNFKDIKKGREIAYLSIILNQIER